MADATSGFARPCRLRRPPGSSVSDKSLVVLAESSQKPHLVAHDGLGFRLVCQGFPSGRDSRETAPWFDVLFWWLLPRSLSSLPRLPPWLTPLPASVSRGRTPRLPPASRSRSSPGAPGRTRQ